MFRLFSARRECSRGSIRNYGPDMDESENGFTLTELLVVILIISLLVAIVAPNVLSRVGGARGQSARAQVENLASALELFMLDTGGYPSSEGGLASLVEPPPNAPNWSGPYLHRGGVPSDPWGRDYVYASNGPDHFSLTTLGRDGEPGGTGEDTGSALGGASARLS